MMPFRTSTAITSVTGFCKASEKALVVIGLVTSITGLPSAASSLAASALHIIVSQHFE